MVRITQKSSSRPCQKSDIERRLPIIQAQSVNQYVYCSINNTEVSLVSILLDRPEERRDICQFFHKSAPLYSGYLIYIPAQRDIFVKGTHLLYMYENSFLIFNEAEEHSIVFTLSEEKIRESVKAGVSDTLSHDGQMIPIQYNKWKTESDEKAEGSVKSAFLVLITFLILRLLILIREAHYSG